MDGGSTNTAAKAYLVVAPWEVAEHGGVDGVIVHLIDEIQRAGPYVPILMQNSWRDRRPRWERKFGSLSVSLRLRSPFPANKTHLLNRATAAFCFTLPIAMLQLSALVAKKRVKLINIHFVGLHSAIFILMRRFGLFRGRVLLSLHGSDLRAGLRLRGFERRAWEWILGEADGVVAVSQALAQALVDEIPSMSGKVIVAYNGVDLATFQSAANRHLLAIKLPRLPRVILTVASLDWYKGVDIVLHAFSKLRQSTSDIRLVLVGHSGTEDENLKALAGALGLDPYVEWHRNVPHSEIPRFMENADIFVLPSRTEGFPLTLLEAGASALPVVATKVGGVSELIDDQVDGLLVPCDDCDALMTAMRRLLADPVAAATMGRGLHQKVRERFSWRAMYEVYASYMEDASRSRQSAHAI